MPPWPAQSMRKVCPAGQVTFTDGEAPTGTSEPADQFHGDRTAALRCPFGHKWILQKHLRDVSPEEAQAQLTKMMTGA